MWPTYPNSNDFDLRSVEWLSDLMTPSVTAMRSRFVKGLLTIAILPSQNSFFTRLARAAGALRKRKNTENCFPIRATRGYHVEK
jgi:hypothetical protein